MRSKIRATQLKPPIHEVYWTSKHLSSPHKDSLRLTLQESTPTATAKEAAPLISISRIQTTILLTLGRSKTQLRGDTKSQVGLLPTSWLSFSLPMCLPSKMGNNCHKGFLPFGIRVTQRLISVPEESVVP